MIESILKTNKTAIDNLSTVLGEIIKRNDLTGFKKELVEKGEATKCFYCEAELKNNIHLDHFIPWDYMKNDELWNFVFSCPKCNSSKNNKLADKCYLEKIKTRNMKLNISSPNIEKIYQYAIMNGFNSGWKPKGDKDDKKI